MPLRTGAYSFPSLRQESFRGLPGMLADSLPDRFGNTLIDAWLASGGRTSESFNSVDRLCYVGTRGMGALEFHPIIGPRTTSSKRIHIDLLVDFASEILSHRAAFVRSLADPNQAKVMRDILLVGTSAGGARAKAVIAFNPATNEVRSGQVQAGPGFEYWLLKFDGVTGNKDKELDDPKGFCAIEFAYSLMAREAGILMPETRLLEENGRRHFMVRRFDRLDGGIKLHMQSLAALAHYDFNLAGAHSYEQAFLVTRQLGLGPDALEQQFRRMAFNIIARNQDDHVKNIAFLMDKSGVWSLSPAFDVTYSYNPSGLWTNQHQMSMNAKRDGFAFSDFRDFGDAMMMKRGLAERLVDEVTTAVGNWRLFADSARVDERQVDQIAAAHRLDIRP
jgi:serine/threonine-protein kinase HipA